MQKTQDIHNWEQVQILHRRTIFLLKWVGASADWSNAISNYGFDVNGNEWQEIMDLRAVLFVTKTPYVFTATWE